MARVLHVVFQRHHYANAFQGEDGGAEEHGQFGDTFVGGLRIKGGQIGENVVEGDANPSGHQNIGQHGQRREILQVPDQVDEDEKRKHRRHVEPDIKSVFFRGVDIHHLLDVLGDEDDVDAAAPEEINDKEEIDAGLGELGPWTEPFRAGEESCFRHLGEPKTGHFGPPAQLMGAFHQNMHAVGADYSDGKGAEEPKEEAGVSKSQRHGQNSAAQTSFEEVDEGVHVPSRKSAVS